MSSIFSTTVSGVGTQTTSFPSWPTFGLYSVAAGCAKTAAATADRHSANRDRREKHHAFISISSRKSLVMGGSWPVSEVAPDREPHDTGYLAVQMRGGSALQSSFPMPYPFTSVSLSIARFGFRPSPGPLGILT